jgi:hypothetical protein
MDQSWQEMNLTLASIRQEYMVICQELKRTNDSQQAIQLRARASTCVAAYQETIRAYQAVKGTEFATSQGREKRE